MRQSWGRGWTRLGEKTLQYQSARTWECTQVIFAHGDQKAFTFRCFPDMNIQHPYWNLIWVSLSQGSFHQCLLPEATADWQPNFSKEQAGKKGRSSGVGDVSGVKLGRAGSDEWSGVLWEVGGLPTGVGYLTSSRACTNRMLQIIRNYERIKKNPFISL